MSAPNAKHFSVSALRASRESVPVKSWYERTRTVPHSRVSLRIRFDIMAGASISRSAKAAPAWMAVMSLDSASCAALVSNFLSSCFCSASSAANFSLISLTRHVATSGTSDVEKSSSVSSWVRVHLSRRISAISISPLARMS